MKKTVSIAIAVIVLAVIGYAVMNRQNSKTESENTTTTPPAATPPASASVYTMAQVQAANSKQKCWTVVDGKVYDLTSFVSEHPGGEARILSLCGKDGTQAFSNQHGDQPRPNNELSGLQIGTLQK